MVIRITPAGKMPAVRECLLCHARWQAFLAIAARKLMKRIDDASFAMDDVILYLDTHPDDRNALNYYRYVVALRKEAVKAYEASFGPLTIEDADDACTWSWLTERWPWEGEV